MASWKEKGEVPDSDDEWDIESQRNEQDGGVHEPELENTAEIDDENAIETENEERIPSQDGAEQSQELLPQDTSANDEASPPEAYEAASTPTNEVDAPLPQIWSSPDLARVFKIPDLEGLSDEEDALRIDARRAQMPATDDISRSYVRITSPLSTQPSSPPGSLLELPPLPRTKSGTTSTLDSLDIETAPPEEHIYESNGQDVETGPNYPMKRSLRQRNAIQLHPYVVEQEKYRRTLKSRGIAPMRLASSQIEPRHAPRKSSSPDPDFQEQETQEVEGDTGESQAMELDWDPPPSSSPVQPVGNQNQNVIDNGDEDEDKKDDNLPDIDELLRSRQQPSGKPGLKRRRIKSYSHKFKRPVLPRILTQPRAPRTTDNGNPIFDVPASPPATSSPFPNPVAHGRVGASRGEPRSLEPTPSLLSQEDIYVQRSVDLPTPATSAIKPPLEPISLTSESESDDPFASDVENSLASSSSDESVQIRKISKKIRGVLPASHLRLDQKNKPQPLSRTNRDSRSASPARMMPRRGVALPRTQSGTLGQQRSLSAATSTGFSFFSDDEDDENDEDGLIMENNPASQLESLFPESRMGFAEEEDKIDAMLPSRKRQSTTSSRPSKKRKTGSSSFLRTGSGTHRRQPKIIDHLGKAPKPSSGMKLKSHRPKGKGRKNAAGPRKPSPPALGILDVTDVFPDRQGTSPDFIRIAARAARARTAQGRHKPAGKFFRLSTREDTEDVQSVLQDWTAGKLQPRNLSEISKHKTQAIRGPLSHIHNNQQTRFDPSISKARPAMQVNPLEASRKVRRLLVSRRQQSMSDFVRKDPTPQDPIRLPVQSQPSHNIDLGAQRRPRFQHHSARPAQLEGSENDYSHRYPSTTFKSSKIALDALYRGTRKRPIPSANLQLSRFLADEDVVRPSIENRSSAECDVLEEAADNTSKRQRARKVGRQKQQPRLVDVGAAVYRQPTDPLILDCFATEAAADASDSKLQGLAKFGTRYTQNFDILPLPPGVFFHASTFVGSGRLSEILRDLRAQRLSPTPIVVSLNLAKTFSWGPWDENVSSEVGLCFDWLVDQLELDSSLPSSCLATAVMDVVMSVLEYMQQSLTFSGPLNETMFLSRMLEVLRDFCSRLRVSHITSHADVQKGVQVLSRICTLTFRLLCVARAKQEYAALSFEFENVLKSTAHKCSQLLLSQDLSVLRKLYDDLQYLSFRDGGIRRDQYAAEAWVILIQVLAAAKISRGSFWDVVGPVLTTADVARTIDAPTMEKMWYSMYTLLPLCEFDEHGVIIQGARRLASFDNWQLPQQMLKRIFSLYKSNPRQSPGFNEYCRSIVSRCHYLMVEWGWWKCSAVIGTLFDFFASQKLAHLRNEEVYTSPHFLEEFDQNPTLAVEPEDRCFHIFLKIVALALKQFSHVGDVKSIRNLVARLLPNHDRQYPKDEVIHQKDLASLRNHHDLLCTMFWASTSAQRPSLATIENLVERGRSHKEAFLVHIRAHANLARFAFSSNQEMEVYTRLNDWQEKDVSSLIDVHRNAELEIRNQAEEGTTEAQISEIVSSNKIQIEAQIFTLLAVWALNIGVTLSLHHAITVLNAHALAKTLSFARTNDRVLGLSINFKVLHQCLTIIDAYAEKVEEFRPEAQQQGGSTEDSQDSIGEVVEYMANRILPLREKSEIPSLYDFLALLARDCLAQEPEGDEEITLTHLVRTWARVVMLFVGTATPDVEKYVIFGRFAVFENREKYKTAKKYWPFFLANLLRHSNDLDYFRIPSFNLELQWLLVLIDPHAVKSFEIDLTNQMVAKGSYLCKSIDTDKASAVVKFKGAVSTMNAILTRSSSQSTNNLPFENAGPVFSDMIRSVETAMQKNLISMEPGSREHKEYLSKVQDVIAHTKAFGRTFWRPSLFFSERSAHYWPDEADPHQFGPTLISYCLRLETEPEKASSEMFFFLYYQWETHVKSHNIKAYIHHLRECTKYWSLVRFMLADLIPVTLQASFKTHSWVLCFHFMQAVVGRVRHILDDSIEKCEFKSVDQLEDKKQKAEWVYTKVLNILAFGADAPGFSKSTLAVLVDFWYSLDYSLRMHNRNELGDRLEPPYGANNVLERFLAASCGFSNDFHHRIHVQTSEHLDSESIVKELINATEKGWELCHVHGQTYVVKSKDSTSDGWVRLPFTAEHVLRSTYRRG